jgi:hypothetical protein
MEVSAIGVRIILAIAAAGTRPGQQFPGAQKQEAGVAPGLLSQSSLLAASIRRQ